MQPQKRNALTELESLKSALDAERTELLARLSAINAALGESDRPASIRARTGRTVRGRLPARKPPGTLEELIVEVTRPTPLSPAEILVAVTKAGYVTTSTDPLKIISTVLARSKQLKSAGRGKFGPV